MQEPNNQQIQNQCKENKINKETIEKQQHY